MTSTYDQSASILGCLQRIESLLRELVENGSAGGKTPVTSTYSSKRILPDRLPHISARSLDLQNKARDLGLHVLQSGSVTSDTKCPKDGEMVNVACYKCGWARPTEEREKALRNFALWLDFYDGKGGVL